MSIFCPEKWGSRNGDGFRGVGGAQHTFGGAQRYLSIFILYFCVNYNDLTATEPWNRGL